MLTEHGSRPYDHLRGRLRAGRRQLYFVQPLLGVIGDELRTGAEKTTLVLLAAYWAPNFSVFALASLTIGFTSVVAVAPLPASGFLYWLNERKVP